ncbi:MAG: peptidylprolyl isomerase, partial [Gemmatimonadaceae bacterium]
MKALQLGALVLLQACARRPDLALLASPDRVLAAGVAPDSFRVKFETSQGPFVARVRRELAPIGVDRFHALVRHGFFDGQRFFRVRDKFIAQFGLHGDPAVIAAWRGRTMPDDPPRMKNRRGTMAYAFTTTGTRSTQIYINLQDNERLNDEPFAPFAEIVEGVEVIDRLYAGYDESAGGGMRAGKQGLIEHGGNTHLAANFPKLDYIRRVR